MIEESLLKTNFLGRDGFRWWIGQIPPDADQEKQLNGSGWGSRFKVRIMGYHPFSDDELPNKDLPYAQVLFPVTAGTGGAGIRETPSLSQGDVVLGFFVDGDDAQIPVIFGAFGRNKSQEKGFANYSSPFVPFSGFSNLVKRPTGALGIGGPYESGNPSTEGQGMLTPRNVPPGKKDSNGKEIRSDSQGNGQQIIPANTCKNSTKDDIVAIIDNLLKKIKAGSSAFINIQTEIRLAIDRIQASSHRFIGAMLNTLYKELETVLGQGVKELYNSLLGIALRILGAFLPAHKQAIAGVLDLVNPLKKVEQNLPCVAGKVVTGLRRTIEDLLRNLISNVSNFVSCAGDQFVGSLLNNIIDKIADAMNGLLEGVSKILSPAFKVADFLRSAAETLLSAGGFFGCNSSKTKCIGSKQYKVGSDKDENNKKDDLDKIIESMQISKNTANLLNEFERQYGKWDIFGTGTKVKDVKGSSSGCYSGPPTSCGGPRVRIFGGEGFGATGRAILGSFVKNTPGLNEVVQNVTKTASIIGVQMTNPGANYRYPPFVEFVDECGRGYGASARSIVNTTGKVIGIYVVNPGEAYPFEDGEDYTVVDVYVDDQGFDYEDDDSATDNLGNQYKLTVDGGKIIKAEPINRIIAQEFPEITITSNTGNGAILRPLLGLAQPPSGEVQNVIDCVTK